MSRFKEFQTSLLLSNIGFVGKLFLRRILRVRRSFLSHGRNSTVGLDQSKNSTLDFSREGFSLLRG